MVLSLCNTCMNSVAGWNMLNCLGYDNLGGQEKLCPFGGFGTRYSAASFLEWQAGRDTKSSWKIAFARVQPGTKKSMSFGVLGLI